jgi:hypothetical protein
LYQLFLFFKRFPVLKARPIHMSPETLVTEIVPLVRPDWGRKLCAKNRPTFSALAAHLSHVVPPSVLRAPDRKGIHNAYKRTVCDERIDTANNELPEDVLASSNASSPSVFWPLRSLIRSLPAS